MHTVILGFDDLVAKTLDVRTEAVEAALRELGETPRRTPVADHVPARSLRETVLVVMGEQRASEDPTIIDLITLRAQRSVSERMRQGVQIASGVRDWMARQASRGVRVVLRADSSRRDVDRLLIMFELEPLCAFTQCADDPLPLAIRTTVPGGSLERSYASITFRLDRQRSSSDRLAFEGSRHAALLAQPFVSHASWVGSELFGAGRDPAKFDHESLRAPIR